MFELKNITTFLVILLKFWFTYLSRHMKSSSCKTQLEANIKKESILFSIKIYMVAALEYAENFYAKIHTLWAN